MDNIIMTVGTSLVENYIANNPKKENITKEDALLLKKAGLNSLEDGIQTFTENALKQAGRHSEKKKALELSKGYKEIIKEQIKRIMARAKNIKEPLKYEQKLSQKSRTGDLKFDKDLQEIINKFDKVTFKNLWLIKKLHLAIKKLYFTQKSI